MQITNTKMLVINWLYPGLKAYPDILPAEWFRKEGLKKAMTHRIGVSLSSPYAGKCDLTVHSDYAILNYFPKAYENFNIAKQNIIGIMKLQFESNKRQKIVEVRWSASRQKSLRRAKIRPSVLFDDYSKLKFPTQRNDPTIFTSIKQRLGQPVFRAILMNIYERKCAISGCDVEQVLEAAHIVSYKRKGAYEPQNGILLRSDLHTLFDQNLLRIDPATYKVHLHPSIRHGQYKKLHGKAIFEPRSDETRLSVVYLQRRWEAHADRVISI